MFNFFKKKQETPLKGGESSLTYYIQEDGEIFCDINLVDYSDETLKRFAQLLVGISSMRFQVQTIEMVQNGFLEADKLPEYEKLLHHIVIMSQQDSSSLALEATTETLTQRQKSEEDPCIKPSDML